MKKKTRLIFLVFSFIILLSSCSKSSQSPSDYSDSLIILNGASNVRYAKLNGTDQVYYKIISEYPVKATTTELNQRLEAKGWQPLDKDWLNPKIPTSHVRGWTDFTDNTTTPNQKAYLWNSYWTNGKKDMLNFVLRYNDPLKAKPNITELNVIGIYIPGKLAKQTIEQVNEYKKSMGKNEKNL